MLGAGVSGRVQMPVILIVEDDAFIRDMAEMTIQGWGYQTLLASDVDEALSHLRSPQHIDVLFTDINLKEAIVGGCELAHQAVALRPELHVLYTTGNRLTEKMKAMFIEGTECLRKPYMADQLHHSVKGLLAAYV